MNGKNGIYHFVGYGTVKGCLSREEIWQNEKYNPYRNFFNILAKPENGKLVQHEIIGEGHDDWENRLTAPYIIFDRNPKMTNFNIATPLFVAQKKPDELTETWLDKPEVNRLKDLLFTQFGITCHLRTTNLQRAHRQIAIHKALPKERTEILLPKLREQLLIFVENSI